DETQISGRLVDESTSEPLVFATVSVHQSPSGELITGAVTSDEGRFEIIGIPQGEYILRFAYLGYLEKEQGLLIGELNRVFDLGRIELAEATQEIDEITVQAQRSTISADMARKTYSLDEKPSQADPSSTPCGSCPGSR
ncbi:carboxypeptidase-like regulatory domain-containing protein, partial [Bacteroidota bacterium]